MNVNVLSLGTACALLLVGCGGGSSTPSSDSDSENTVLTGVFVDSPVEGASYTTQTQTGITNVSGEFSYLVGEQVTFSIGAIQLPAVAAATQVTPIDISASSTNPTAMTTNIARLLQSLDLDGNPDNGITIPTTAAESSANLNFDVSTENFANDTAVINLVANSGSVTTALVSADAANAHLNTTLGITTTPDNSVIAFNVADLVTGSPWYAIRVYEGRQECGNSYTFTSDGSLSAGSNGETITGTYTLSDTGSLGLDTVQFGVETRQLNTLSPTEWTSNSINNSGGEYLERVFSSRDSALSLANSLGTNCDSELPM